MRADHSRASVSIRLALGKMEMEGAALGLAGPGGWIYALRLRLAQVWDVLHVLRFKGPWDSQFIGFDRSRCNSRNEWSGIVLSRPEDELALL